MVGGMSVAGKSDDSFFSYSDSAYGTITGSSSAYAEASQYRQVRHNHDCYYVFELRCVYMYTTKLAQDCVIIMHVLSLATLAW